MEGDRSTPEQFLEDAEKLLQASSAADSGTFYLTMKSGPGGGRTGVLSSGPVKGECLVRGRLGNIKISTRLKESDHDFVRAFNDLMRRNCEAMQRRERAPRKKKRAEPAAGEK